MRPDKLAVLIADAIRAVVAPLVKQVADLKVTVAAFEARDKRRDAAIADLQKSQIETRQAVLVLESFHPAPNYVDLRADDPRH